MAFTGTAVVKQVADNLVRITGLSLAGGAAGTIALHEATVTPGVRLPAGFKPREYKNAEAADVALQDSLEVSMNVVSDVTTLVPVKAVKTGTKPDDATITLTNTTVGTASAQLEIYVRHH
jgi:hypothetical protein